MAPTQLHSSLSADAMQTLIAEREAVRGERDVVRDELRVMQVERDLLKEKLEAFQRRLFGAKSEAPSAEQRDLFLNEAEALAANAALPSPESEIAVPVPGHQRKKPGRKPLDPALPREVIRTTLPESARICAHDGAILVEIGVDVSEQFDIILQQVRVIRHERVKYACPCCDQSIKVTPARLRILP
ncbi:hypothetical protein HNR39_004566 [Glaciimonas immobilis]|uniref:IS66 family transposase n=1 Tax=Glaciimonas immobilis TaxID=728004 RepID=A0A840S0U1_9BURK|nr:hypothetical protein [Glaciimonas immobilis]